MAGYKNWLRLEEVTSDDMNGYLADQVVLRFPSAASRSADLPFPDDGMVSYLLDTDRTEVWDATLNAWVPVAGTVLGQVRIATDQGLPGAPSWQAIATLPSATYHAGRTYRLSANPCVGNSTGSTVDVILRWMAAAAVNNAAGYFTVFHSTRVQAAADQLWTPASTWTGALVLQGQASVAMGVVAGLNGVLGASVPLTVSATCLGVVPGATPTATDAEAELLPAGED